MIKTEQVVMSTDRLILKSITPEIIHEVYSTFSKEEVMNYFGFDEVSYSRCLEMHEKGVETYRTTMFYFMIISKDSNKPIGDCGFHTWDFKHNRAEMFYNLHKDEYKRKGYMTEVMCQVLNHAFTELKIHRVEALVADWNIASVRLLEHFNFKKEGTMREDYIVDGKNEDSDCYSLLKWEWEESLAKKRE